MAKKKNLKERLKNVHQEVEETIAKTTNSGNDLGSDGMLFQKENYILMGVSVVLIVLGFILMSGGRHADPNVFDADSLYSFRRITLAPILVLLGFAVAGYAILKKPSTK